MLSESRNPRLRGQSYDFLPATCACARNDARERSALEHLTAIRKIESHPVIKVLLVQHNWTFMKRKSTLLIAPWCGARSLFAAIWCRRTMIMPNKTKDVFSSMELGRMAQSWSKSFHCWKVEAST